MPQHAKDALFLLAVVFLLAFAPFVLRSGFYLDDMGFLITLDSPSWESFWNQLRTYVPGRNIQIAYWWALIQAAGGQAFGMHFFGLIVTTLTAVLAYLVVYSWTGLVAAALPAALAHALFMHHGESHFWLSALLQAHVSSLFALAALYAAARAPGGFGARSAAAMSLYALGLASYDQVFFLWPLVLAALWWSRREGEKPWPALIFSSAFAIALNLGHFLFRHYAESSGGGRPVVRFGAFFERMRESVWACLKGTFAVPTRGVYDALPTAVLALAAAAVSAFVILRARSWMNEEGEEARRYAASPGPLRLAAFGAAWFFLAYLPTYFWYLSPRHNQVPSFGWALLLTAAGLWLGARHALAARVLPAAAFLLLGNALAAQWLEGSEWVKAGRLHEAFLKEARKVADPLDNLFLIGAPRYLRKAPAFHLPHDVTMRAARERGLGVDSVRGDARPSPGPRGLFYSVDPLINAPSDKRFIPYSEANAVSYSEEEGFKCLGSLAFVADSGASIRVPLRQSWGCDAVADVELGPYSE